MTVRTKYGLLAIPLLVAFVCIALYYDDMNESPISHKNRRAADFDHFTFYGYPNFVEVSIRPISEARLYVQVPDGRRFLLKDLPEEVASKFTREKFDGRDDPVQPVNEISYISGKTSLVYREGKLHHAYFKFPKGDFRFSSRLDGPYLELPVTAEQLIQVFGEPKEWRRPGHMGPPF